MMSQSGELWHWLSQTKEGTLTKAISNVKLQRKTKRSQISS